MKENFTDISIVLDRSGSMGSIKDDTIGGFNQFIEDQQKVEGKALLSLIQFDSEYSIVHSAIPIKETPKLTDKTFIPRASTALYDAIGRTILATGIRLNGIDESDRPDKVIFVIITDGYENASREFDGNTIKQMIEHQTKIYNWEFVYLGANQDAITVANDMGIGRGQTLSYAATSRGTKSAFASISKGMTMKRTFKGLDGQNMNYFNQDDRDAQDEV